VFVKPGCKHPASSSSSSPATETLGPGIRSPGLDPCKFVPDARQLDLAPGS
jgi:hypothetical protein